MSEDGKRKVQHPYFMSKPFTTLAPQDINEAMAKAYSSIEAKIDKLDAWRIIWLSGGLCGVVVRQHCRVKTPERQLIHPSP